MLMTHQLPLAIQLNHQTTLQDYCWGDNNFLKQQLMLTLAGAGERFIYLWGEPGCGKSHLLQGSCQYASAQELSCVYLPLACLKDWGANILEDLEQQHLIAIDDIDVIAHDHQWQEALFHLYNRVRDNEKTLLLISGKRAPSLLNIQLADLRSRLSWGLTLPIIELNDELKISVLQQHAKKSGFELTSSVAFFLLNRCSRSMHDLYQILEQLDSASLAAKRKITIPFVKTILQI